MMAQGMLAQQQDNNAMYCPLLDARRMEVYTAIYDAALNTLLAPHALILTPESLREWLDKGKIYFFGDGSMKWEQLMAPHTHASFVSYHMSAEHMIPLSEAAFSQRRFEDVAYFSPYYLKPFYTPGAKA